jgi:hypothetical protein
MSEHDLHYVQKSRLKQKNSTFRNYPQRDKQLKVKTFSIKMFKNQEDFDRIYNVLFNKGTESKKIGYFIWFDNVNNNPLFKNINYIKNFANNVYEEKIEGFQLDHLTETLELPKYSNGTDMTYQEFANFLNCKVVVNENLRSEFDITMGHTNDQKYCGSGFGRVDIKNYSQRGFSNQQQKEDPKNLTYFVPAKNNGNVKMNEYIVMIFPPISKSNYQYSTQMKIAYPMNDVCESCWYNNGRIWMLKGMGFKSLKKNKGMKKNNKSYLKDIDI